MKCGICGEETRKGHQGIMEELTMHKKIDHPKEYQAMLEARREKRDAAKAAEASEAKRRGAKRLAASQPVVARNTTSVNGLVSTFPSSNLRRFELSPSRLSRPRFPGPAAYSLYQDIWRQITELEKTAQEFLVVAWETGTLVTLEHLDELDRAEGVAP